MILFLWDLIGIQRFKYILRIRHLNFIDIKNDTIL